MFRIECLNCGKIVTIEEGKHNNLKVLPEEYIILDAVHIIDNILQCGIYCDCGNKVKEVI